MNLKKNTLFLIACVNLFSVWAQRQIPNMPLLDEFGGVPVSDVTHFVPSLGDYTLEVQGQKETEISIAFAGINYTPAENAVVRFTQKEGKVYIFENGVYKAVLTPNPEYSTSGDNLIQNPGFEDVSGEFTSGRWKPAVWDTWDGGKPTWGGDVGKTNVREDVTYRSEGVKSIIMHSETRQLLQELPSNSLQASENYLLTYDYWTSSGSGNGGVTYQIHLRSEKYADGTTWLQHITGHTTSESGTEKSSFSTVFQAASGLPQTVYFVFVRNESKVDWLDNLKLYKIIPANKGITGTTSIVYLAGSAYAPGNLSFEEGDYIDMTGRIINPGFGNNTNGWNITANGSKISTSEKGGGLIPGNQNHLQFWAGSGGIHGKLAQTITRLPNGKYRLKAAIAPSFNGTVSLYANASKTTVISGTNKYYEVTGIVYDGSLEIGLEIAASGSPTLDLDDFQLYYSGIDAEGYLGVLSAKMAEAKADTTAMKSTDGKPGYNNLQQYREAFEEVTNRPDDDAETLIAAITTLNAAIDEYDAILAAYEPLKTAMAGLETLLIASGYPVKTTFTEALNAAQAVYNSKEDQRGNIESSIATLTEKMDVLTDYVELKTAVTGATTMLNTTGYPGKTEFQTAIDAAREVITNPEGKDITSTLTALNNARTVYYNSQYTEPAVQQTVSWVDTSLNGSEKFVLRIGGKPFYMTNIQVRLDKLYGYEGWGEAALEAVVKRAADDGFNTVSIPIHWREIEPVKDKFDWTLLDKFLGWCKKYNLKTELLWFSWSSGGRVQYLWNYGGRKELRTPDYVCSLDGKSEYNVLRKDWEYSLDWRDTNLRDREKYVVRQMMEHVALWDANNGNPKTVIGVQLGNEARAHGNNGATSAEIINFYHHVGAGVKESKYVVWTRLNCVSYETSGRISANESKRNNGGTNIDFVGVDIYGSDAGMIKGDMWGYLPSSGKNYRMIMEIDAKDSKSPLYQMAALAGDKAFDYYNMGPVDGNGLYTNTGQALAERDHITLVRQRNRILNLVNEDLALKKQGVGLYVYNYAGNSTSAETGIEGISFTPDATTTQAVSVRRSETEIVLLSTLKGVFSIPASLDVVSATKGYFDADNKWVDEGEVTLNGAKLTMPATSAVLLKLKGYEPEDGIRNPGFERGTTSVEGLLVPTYWTVEATLSGSDVKLSTINPATGAYKYNIWASSVTSIDLYQYVELSEGEYTLAAALRTDNETNVTDQHIYVQVANNARIKSQTLVYAAEPYWQFLSVDFAVPAGGATVRTGAASTGKGTTAGWFQIDDFSLKSRNPSSAEFVADDNQILEIIAADGGVSIAGNHGSPDVNIYSITGQLLKTVAGTAGRLFVSLEKGIYIVGDQKVIVK